MSGTLVLVRHGQSEWNLKNLFTGWRDVDLTEQGIAEAKAAGADAEGERGLKFDIAFTSALTRAQTTCEHHPRRSSARAASRPSATRRSTSATTATSPASTRTMPAQEVGRGAGAHLAPLLRRGAARRRKPEGHRRARLALLSARHPAARAARRDACWSPRTAIRCAR